MTQSGTFAACRVDPDVVERALGRLRRRDLRVWRGDPHWVENSGPDGTGRIVRWDGANLVPVTEHGTAVGSSLYGYGAPAWSPMSPDRAVALTTRPLGVLDVTSDGTDGARSPLDGLAAGYVSPMGRRVVVLVDRGSGRGRTIVCGSPGAAFTTVYETSNLVSDVTVASDGARAAWIEWSVGTMPWDAGRLWIASIDERGAWNARTIDLDGPCAQPTFTADGLVADVEVGEWFHPFVLENDRLARVALPEGDFRPDWCLGHTWACAGDASSLTCAVRESRSYQWRSRGEDVTELRDGPAYLYDVSRSEGGFVALGSSPTDRGALWSVADTDDHWRCVSGHTDEHRWSGRPEVRRTAGGVPYVWYWPDVGDTFTPTDRPGLVVLVHGGPTKYASLEFSWVIELICRSGFAVASVDHRGSTSYGRSHRVALDGHWGEVDVTDVTAVLSDVVTSGDVDPDRVVVRGTSAGALSALLVASDAAVTGVVVVSPVTDPLALFGSPHDFDCNYARQLTGGEERALARSPLQVIDALPRRMLVIHGANDDIVPVEHTRTFVAALEERGRTVTYVELEGEGHSFRRLDSGRRALLAETEFYASLNQP